MGGKCDTEMDFSVVNDTIPFSFMFLYKSYTENDQIRWVTNQILRTKYMGGKS